MDWPMNVDGTSMYEDGFAIHTEEGFLTKQGEVYHGEKEYWLTVEFELPTSLE